jgi:hypothetical protein
MLGATSLVSVLLGTAAAIAAERCTAYRQAVEIGAGILFIGGVALAGTFLPVIL